jgi:hypothetical protein
MLARIALTEVHEDPRRYRGLAACQHSQAHHRYL